MPVPTYGAAPISNTFLLVRVLQIISMIIVIGIASNFVSLIVNSGVEAPQEFVGTLSVVSNPCENNGLSNNRVDLHRNPLRRHLDRFLLVSGQSWPSRNGRCRLPSAHRLHRCRRHIGQASVFPQLLRHRKDIRPGRCPISLRVRHVCQTEFKRNGIWTPTDPLGGRYKEQLLPV